MSDEVRLLHRRAHRGYTDRLDQALLDEPEAVSVEDQDLITARSHRAAHEAQLQEWTDRRDTVARHIDWLYSQRLRRDVRAQVRRLQHQLDGLDKKLAAG